MYRHRQIAGKTYSHVSRRGVEKRISETMIADELHRDRPRSSFYLRPTAQPEQGHAAASSTHLHRPRSAAHPHATPFGMSRNRTVDISQIQIAPAAHHVQITFAFLHLNTSGAGLNRRRPRRADINTATAQVNLGQSANIGHANIRRTAGERQIAAQIARPRHCHRRWQSSPDPPDRPA